MKKKEYYRNLGKGSLTGLCIIGLCALGCLAWQRESCILAGLFWLAAAAAAARICTGLFNTIDFLRTLQKTVTGEEEDEFFSRLWFLERREEELLEKMREKAEVDNEALVLKREAELHALQNQINPHFLYNTLEIIRSKALIRGVDDVAEMTEALGTLFRYYINRPGEMATIDEELDNVKNYVLIQKYRFPNRFRFEVHVEDRELGVLNRLIPVLTIQPLVENAISHGLANRTEGGLIQVYVHLCDDDQVYIIIMDNGVGIDEETLTRMRHRLRNPAMDMNVNKIKEKSPGIAMDNVNRRIRFYFGEEYGIEIQSTLGVGTNVVVRLPSIVM